MATIPINDPVIPFLGLIPGGVQRGTIIRVRGQIQGYGNRCNINLQKGPALKPSDDILLHISIRPQDNAVVRNHFTSYNQSWGSEERYGGNPVSVNQFFEVMILVESVHYKIAFNGRHFCVFKHRLPLHEAQYVSINGGCTVQYIGLDTDASLTPTAPPVIIPPVVPSYPTYPIHRPSYPSATPSYPPVHRPSYPIHQQPGFAPPPPPYPGLAPGQSLYPHATPYSVNTKSSNKNLGLKVAAVGAGAAAVGLTAYGISQLIKGDSSDDD